MQKRGRSLPPTKLQLQDMGVEAFINEALRINARKNAPRMRAWRSQAKDQREREQQKKQTSEATTEVLEMYSSSGPRSLQLSEWWICHKMSSPFYRLVMVGQWLASAPSWHALMEELKEITSNDDLRRFSPGIRWARCKPLKSKGSDTNAMDV